MSSDGTFNYQYDPDGNLTSRMQIASTYSTQYETTYSWDYRNRLTDVEYFDNNDVLTKHVHYVYDVFDHLIATEVDSTGSGSYNEIDRYALDVSPEVPQAGVPSAALAQPVLVFDGNENLIGRNLVALNPAGVDAVMAQGAVSSPTVGDVVTWLADDKSGTTRDIVDNSGALANHVVYTAFGEVDYESDPAVISWTGFGGGHLATESGLIEDGLRWYDAGTGRWLSVDPKQFQGGDSNLTRYVGNNATNAIDPHGEMSNLQTGAMIAFPWMIPAIVAMEVANSVNTAEMKAAAMAQMNELMAQMQQMLPAPGAAPGAVPGAALGNMGQPPQPAGAAAGLGVAVPYPFTATSVAIASAVIGAIPAPNPLLPPAAPPVVPAPPAMPNGGGAIGGFLGGALNGGIFGGAGAAVGGAIAIGVGVTIGTITAPVWGTFVTTVGIGVGVGAILGGVSGMIVGANLPGFGPGFDNGWNDPWIAGGTFGVGSVLVGGFAPFLL